MRSALTKALLPILIIASTRVVAAKPQADRMSLDHLFELSAKNFTSANDPWTLEIVARGRTAVKFLKSKLLKGRDDPWHAAWLLARVGTSEATETLMKGSQYSVTKMGRLGSIRMLGEIQCRPAAPLLTQMGRGGYSAMQAQAVEALMRIDPVLSSHVAMRRLAEPSYDWKSSAIEARHRTYNAVIGGGSAPDLDILMKMHREASIAAKRITNSTRLAELITTLRDAISKAKRRTGGWDFESHLTSIDFPATSNDDSHEYDGDGRRMRSKLSGASDWTNFVQAACTIVN